MRAICQRCGREDSNWNIHQAEINVGKIERWRVQMCPTCTELVERFVRDALRHETKESQRP